MSEPATLPRPRQVTMAGVLAIVASVLVVVTVFETITGLRGLETREAVERFLSEPPGNGLGLSVQGTLTLLQAVSMVAAGCAAAAAILGFHVLKRSRSARLGLTVLAVPMFLSGLVAGGFLSSLVAAAALMLWLEPARDWFDGRPARTAPERPDPERRAVPQAPPPSQPPAAGSAPVQPRPHEGFGRAPQPPTGSADWPPPTAGRARRPDAVLWASLLTWIFAGLATVLMALSALVLATSPDLVMEELRRQNPDLAGQGLTDSMVRTATFVAAAVTVVWSTIAGVLAFLLFRGVRWARIALVACAAAAGLLCLAGAVRSVPLLVPVVACGAVIALLLRQDVRDWCSRS